MEFDINKIYTCVNADELKIGSKVIVASSLDELKSSVQNYDSYKGYVGTLSEVRYSSYSERFKVCVNAVKAINTWLLAYLVEEPKPLLWTDINVGDVIVKDNTEYMVLAKDYNANIFSHILVINKGWLSNSDLKGYTKKEK